jgi:hypothetical protein
MFKELSIEFNTSNIRNIIANSIYIVYNSSHIHLSLILISNYNIPGNAPIIILVIRRYQEI